MGKAIFRKRKKRRNLLPLLLTCLITAVLAVGVVAWTLSQQEPPQDSSQQQAPDDQPVPEAPRRVLPKEFIDRNTYSPYVVLYDVTGSEMLYSKNADQQCYPASLTKLMTALIAVENADPDTVITVGNEVNMIAAGSSRAYLTAGTKMNLTQLLQAMLLPSGNDAAYVTAVHIGRILAGDPNLDRYAAVSKFCEAMNNKAKELGCTGTSFVNPDGYHEDSHYTTASDMLKIAIEAIQHPLIAQVVSQPSVKVTLLTGQTATWHNSNRLVLPDNAYYYEGAFGLKTGTTDEAGRCLAACATRGGRTTIAIVLGAATENGRWDDARGLLDISFQ